MSDHAAIPDRLFDLAGVICDQCASENDFAELDSMVRVDRETRDCYLAYCRMHCAMKLEFLAHEATQAAFEEIGIGAGWAATRMARAVVETPALPLPSLPASLWNGTVSYFSSGWMAAYLTAMVIMGISFAVMAIVHVSQPLEITHHFQPVMKQQRTVAREEEIVGRITGMVDWKWDDPHEEVVNGDHVPLGRKYTLASGLMEITYDTGAKVILQGPVTYEVESKNGGFMCVGKLTAKAETKQAKGFVVRTPTVIATDLGTEFGVEVSKEGNTTSHIYRGSVRLQTVSRDRESQSVTRILHENESARVENHGNQGSGNRMTILDTSAKPADFVREISQPTPKPSKRVVVVANWQFDGDHFLADSSGNNHTLVNRGATQVDGAALFNGKAMMSSVDSIDLTPYTKVRVSWSEKATSPNSDQVVWEQSENYNFTPGAICAWHSATGGMAAIHGTGEQCFNLDEYPVAADTWENFTVEYNLITDRGDRAACRADVVKVFKDGTQIGLATRLESFAPESFVNAAFHIGARAGAAPPLPIPGFTGLIDNVKIEGTLRSNNATVKSTANKGE